MLRVRYGEARGFVRSFDGEVLEVEGNRALAPGAPIRLEVEGRGKSWSVEARALGSKRIADATFVVRLRLVNLRRTDRLDLLEAAKCSHSGGDAG